MIKVERKKRILHIVLENKLNKLSFEFTKALAQNLDEADKDKDIAVIILQGNEKAFSVGAALDELIDLKDHEIDAWLKPWEKLAEIKKPVIVALDGYVLGGGLEIAMMGDILIATDKTFVGQPEINLALLPGCGGTLRLMQCVGYHRALEMCLRGDFINAEKAYELGLLNHVVSQSQLKTKAFQVAEAIAKHSIPALVQIKSLLRQGFDQSLQHVNRLKAEREAFRKLIREQDGREGLLAFLEKREPIFVDG